MAQKNSFTIKPNEHRGKHGYYEYSLSVTADNFSVLTQEQKNLYKALDDMPISATAYDALNKILSSASNIDTKKLDKTGGIVVGAGDALDAFDFLCVVASDYSDDGEAGKDTTKKVTALVSSWLGDLAGGYSGVAAGAAVGTAVMPGVGTAVGGAIGAVLGAYILSSVMEDVGIYLGGIDYGTTNTIDLHIARGR